MMQDVPSPHIVWGAELSPFVLKLESMLRAAGLPFRRLPRDGTRWENLRAMLRIEAGKRRRDILRYPETTALDEYPLVPFLITPDGPILYDTSALANWIDDHHRAGVGPLIPAEPSLRFACRLIDEAFDEFGLYMVHHNRWKVAARDNDLPGLRLAREYARHLPPGTTRMVGQWFARRQVRRLPYLFSVAPNGYSEPELPAVLTPPARDGFPPTHALLESAWERSLAACETVLREQPFLLGGRFTLADASAYGQLSMNLTDPAADRRLRDLAPRTHTWLHEIRDGNHVAARGELHLDPALRPLLSVIMEAFVPLMRQNADAHRRATDAGETKFNEAGFDHGRGLYDGQLLDFPFRSVVKTFQVRVWRDLCADWQALDSRARMDIEKLAGSTDLTRAFSI